MGGHVCPWWAGYFIDNPLRRLLHSPERIVGDLVCDRMRVLDFGCGMGFFTIPMARKVGSDGLVVAADVQPQMLQVLRKRARRAGVAGRIVTHLTQPNCLALSDELTGQGFDFVLAFYALHETADPGRICRQIAESLRPAGRVLVVEPIGHVSRGEFGWLIEQFLASGLREACRPSVRLSRASLMQKL